MDKLTPQENKPEIIKRVSGTQYDPETMEGKAALRVMKYSKLSADGYHYEVDTTEIKLKAHEYIREAEETGKYSESALCIHLGIARETLRRWHRGYVSQSDMADESVVPNIELSESLRAQVMRIEQYWEECSNTGLSQKHVRLMESRGIITGKHSKPTIVNHGTMNLGIFDEWSK